MVSPRMRTRPMPTRKGEMIPTPRAGSKFVRKITAQHDTITLESAREVNLESRLARFIIGHRAQGRVVISPFDVFTKPASEKE